MAKQALAQSARTALVLGGGFTLVRDLLQFGAMLLMVRLLTPEDYGVGALAQSFFGLISVLSFGTFASHALQFREPSKIDWQVHFTAAIFLNSTLFLATLLIALGLSFTRNYAGAALPLAGLATAFLVEIPGTLRHRMLETGHEWVQFRLLLIMGTVLGLGAGLLVALMGGGVWALVIQPPLFGLPAAVDLFRRGNWRPDWSWSWGRYRDIACFGFNRMGASAAMRGRQAVEQTVLAGVYDLASLGIFTRSMGLATLVAGRVGSVAMQALYPVVTRAEIRSARFQRIAGLVLQSVCWTTIPAAMFFAINAADTVSLLYGQQWASVVPLLPVALMGVALNGIAGSLSGLLLANNQLRFTLIIEIAGAVVAAGLALWLIPKGIIVYLEALVVLGLLRLMSLLVALGMTGGIDRKSCLAAFLPAVFACVVSAACVKTGQVLIANSLSAAVRLLLEGAVFASVYVLVLRLVFASSTRELLNLAPGGQRAIRWLWPGSNTGPAGESGAERSTAVDVSRGDENRKGGVG